MRDYRKQRKFSTMTAVDLKRTSEVREGLKMKTADQFKKYILYFGQYSVG